MDPLLGISEMLPTIRRRRLKSLWTSNIASKKDALTPHWQKLGVAILGVELRARGTAERGPLSCVLGFDACVQLECACGAQRHGAVNHAFTVQIRAMDGWQPRVTGVPEIAGPRCNGGWTGSTFALLLWVNVTIRQNSISSGALVAREDGKTSYAAC